MAWNDEGDEAGLWWITEPRVRHTVSSAETFANRGNAIRALIWDAPEYHPPALIAPPSGVIAIDLETEDPDLSTRGPSWAFEGRGQILGVSVAWREFEAYYSIGHAEGNVNPQLVMDWLRDTIRRDDIEVVCAHAAYDIGWLRRELGCYPLASPHDVQFQGALLDENRLSYALDALARSYLGEGKAYDMIDAVADRVLCKRGEVFSHLKELPAKVVAPYAIPDATLTYRLHHTLMPDLVDQELMQVYQLERDLITLSVEMRRRGIRVDVPAAERLLGEYGVKMGELQDEIQATTGVRVEPWEGETCALALESRGHVLPRTSTGKPSVTKEILGSLAVEDSVARSILRLRKLSKACTTFLEGHVLSYAEGGRIHPTYNQLRRDDADQALSIRGTVSGRYSVDSPNVQQLPIRDPDIGKAVRGVFLPEEGQLWCSLDYKSQEPRLLVEFAARAGLRGAADAVRAYQEDPNLDMHQWVADLCGISREKAKGINLGRAYGMASKALARNLGLPTKWMAIVGKRWIELIDEPMKIEYTIQGYNIVEVGGDETMELIRKWETHAPFIKEFINLAKDVAEIRGFVKTLLQRRCRFIMQGDGYAWTYAAANRIIQGSAADQTKTAMLHMWQDNIVPLLTLHDELGFSVDNESEGRRYGDYMEQAIPLSVPMVCEPKLAVTWAGAK
jgi:DNA polymerase I-like protein with 3'-5' exonuclease and polymerase domains